MGTSTDALLLYGYNLGSSEKWKIQGLGEYEEWSPDWLDEDEDLPESALIKLRTVAGFTETDWNSEGYFKRRNAVDAQIGVTIKMHCHSEYPMYVLSAKTLIACRGYPQVVEFESLELMIELDAKLRHALDVLDIKPVQKLPAWILCSYWG